MGRCCAEYEETARRGDGPGHECLAISGHSLGAVPVDREGRLLRNTIPIWSDARAQEQARRFFEKVDENEWYLTTGNGFPSALYTVFKIMWYMDNEPDIYRDAFKIIGTKDYINLRLTGVIKTDHSYASGSGVYDLKRNAYHEGYITASGISADKLPDIIPSTAVLGTLTPRAAEETGLGTNVKVVCGGVDNSCMALGAKNVEEGRVYTSLGSSAWIAVSSTEPVLDPKRSPTCCPCHTRHVHFRRQHFLRRGLLSGGSGQFMRGSEIARGKHGEAFMR